MISWIQNHLIRHGRWIFLSLLALIIVAFVFTIGNTPGCTSDRTAYQELDYYGYDLNSNRDIEPMAQRTSLSAMLNGQQIRGDQQFQAEVMARIAILALGERLNLPAPQQSTLSEYIQTKAAFRGPDGNFSPDAYTRFVDNMESNPQLSQGVIVRTLEEDYMIEQIRDVLAGPGYVLPSEAKLQVQNNETTLSLDTAQFAYADFEPEIDTNEEALKTYYNSQSSRYQIPERIQASYLSFPSAAYTDSVDEATEAELRQHFISNRSRFVEAFKSTLDEAEQAEATVTFDDVKDAVAKDYKIKQAKRAAHEAAQNFALNLYRNEIKRDSAGFNKFLNENGYSLIEIEPYTASGANQRALSSEMLQSAFALSNDRYFSDAYEIEDGFAVLIYQGRIAPEIPAFEAVKDEVITDFKSEEKRRLYSEKGASLQSELEAKMAEGLDFKAAAEALDLSVQSFEAFKVAEAPRELNPSVIQQAISLKPGSVSPMIRTGAVGTFIHLNTKEVPEIGPENEAYTQSLDFLSNLTSYLSANSLGNELVSEGLPAEDLETE